MLLLLLSLILLIPCIYIGLTYPIKFFLIRNFFSRFKNSKAICLTFDDGPHPQITPCILQILKEEGIKATFFVLGKNVLKYPQIIQQIKKDGHEIGEHGYEHCHPWKNSPIDCIKDINKCSNVLQPYHKPGEYTLYRPPFGKFNIISLLYLLLIKKSKIIFWNLDTKDYKVSAQTVTRTILNRQPTGSIILMHDGRDGVKEEKNESTIDGLKLALKQLRPYKHTFKTIGEVLDIFYTNKHS